MWRILCAVASEDGRTLLASFPLLVLPTLFKKGLKFSSCKGSHLWGFGERAPPSWRKSMCPSVEPPGKGPICIAGCGDMQQGKAPLWRGGLGKSLPGEICYLEKCALRSWRTSSERPSGCGFATSHHHLFGKNSSPHPCPACGLGPPVSGAPQPLMAEGAVSWRGWGQGRREVLPRSRDWEHGRPRQPPACALLPAAPVIETAPVSGFCSAHQRLKLSLWSGV